MYHLSLYEILNKRRTEILSSAATLPGDNLLLQEFQNEIFSCIISLLNGKNKTISDDIIPSITKNLAAHHDLGESITALDKLEKAILESAASSSTGESFGPELLQINLFFCDARRIVTESQSTEESGANAGTKTQGRPLEEPQPISLFDKVMQNILDASIGPDKVLRMICESVLKMTAAAGVGICMLDKKAQSFVLREFMAGPEFKQDPETIAPKLSSNFRKISRRPDGPTGLFDIALKERETIFCADLMADPRVYMPEVFASLGITSLLVVPMFCTGEEYGFMAVGSDSSRTFSQSEIDSLSLFADQAAVAWRNAELYNEARESEHKYRDLIENAIDIIFVLDLEGKFVSINKRGEDVAGFKAEDWIGRDFTELISKEDLPEVMDGWARGLKGGTNILPVRIRHANGEDIHLEVNSSLIEEQGELTGMMCIARDATAETKREAEFKKLHESVVETNRKLAQSMETLKATQAKLIETERLSAMGELVSGIAHELNNPLTGIMGYAQLLHESLADSQYRKNLQKINNEALRCKKIVQNLLGFARHHKPEKRVIDVETLIQSVVELKQYQAYSDGIHLAASHDDSHPQIVGDFHQLQQVLLNIIANAHQAMACAGIKGKIEIETRADNQGGFVQILIADEGPGIPPENLSKIFDPFFTTKDVGEGTGLGLSVAYGIVGEHGGQLSVEDVEQRGATFEIVLPQSAAMAGSSGPEEVKGTRPVNSNQKRRALLVDDEEVILDLLGDVLEQMGISVEKAHNGKEALKKVEASQFDFIICDVRMPGMNGVTLYHKLQKLDENLSRRVIFSTGDTLSDDFAAFRTATNCRFIEKPFLIEDVKSAIEALDWSENWGRENVEAD